MAHTTQGAPAPTRSTKVHPFFGLSPDVGYLFDVRQGVPLLDALQASSNFLAAARNATYAFAKDKGDEAFGVAYLIDMAKAAVDASVEAAFEEVVEDAAKGKKP